MTGADIDIGFLELELYFYLNTVNLSDKIIILKKLQSALIYINML